ncbi:MAG: spermidine synthase [Marmoricola sp.]
MTEIARATSSRGDIMLRSRESEDGHAVLELRVNGVFVMDDEETSSERALAHAALDALGDVLSPVRVLVGGLGLGFTLAELQGDPRVGDVIAVEIEEAVVEWHRSGVIPHGPSLLSSPSTTVVIDDVATVIGSSTAAFDLILLDVDNGPRYLVHDQNAALYREDFLHTSARALTAGGALCVWVANRADDLATAMEAVFGNVEVLSYPVRLQGRNEHYLLYLSRLMSTL